MAISPLIPVVAGSVTSYSVLPALPAGLTLNAATGTISGTPTVATTQTSYTVSAANSAGQATFQIVMTVIASQAANGPPVAGPASFDTNEDTRLIAQLPAASDPDGDAVTYYDVTMPVHGRLSIGASGTFDYIPDANYHGVDSFTYRVSDNRGGSNAYGVTISVLPLNDAPAVSASRAPLSYGFRGSVLLEIPDHLSGPVAADSVVLDDGRVLLSADGGRGLVLARFTAEGMLDSTFGGGDGLADRLPAQLIIDGGGAMVLQSDGSILLAAACRGCGHQGPSFAVFRYTADGELDQGFGAGAGFAATPVGLPRPGFVAAYASDITLQTDGKIVVAGSAYNGSTQDRALVRFNANGSADSSFGDAGVMLSHIGTASSSAADVITLADGRMIVTGAASAAETEIYCVVTRHNANGTLDNTFGDGTGVSMITYRVGIGLDGNPIDSLSCTKAKLLSDGKILTIGDNPYTTAVPTRSNIFLIRLNSNGLPDGGFGSGGVLSFEVPGNSSLRDLQVLDDGRILVAAAGLSSGEGMLLRFLSVGSIDTSFGGGDGVANIELGSPTTLRVRSDDRILCSVSLMQFGVGLSLFEATGTLDSGFGPASIIEPGQPFSFTWPAERVTDPDGDSLTYTADLAWNVPLPAWLSFDASTRTFSGIAPSTSLDSLLLRISASDPQGLVGRDTSYYIPSW